MKKLLTTALTAATGIVILSSSALALNNFSLEQQNLLPRDQYIDLVDPEKYNVNQIKVKFSEETRIRLRDGELVSLEGLNTFPIKEFLNSHPSVTVERHWTQNEDVLDAITAKGEANSGIDLADLNNWYTFVVKGDNAAPKELLQDLLKVDLIQTCFYHPIPTEATCNPDPAPVTGFWEANQDYREAAPAGVDIEYAWDFHADGNGVTGYYVIDVERGWCVGHEDMDDNFSVYGYDAAMSTGHGSAVVSIVAACDNDFGITGMVPDVRMKGRNWNDTNGGTYPDVSDALVETGLTLWTGETYLIEIHAQGPDPGTTCPCNCDQFRYIAMEYWQDNFDAILANATAEGLICMEAAGNGSMDLDWWGYSNAFDRSFRDCQAILVGASTSGTPHEPACFTNHGSAIDVYGWGENVYSHGYGYMFNNGVDCTQNYRSDFSGTSSATPICTGPAVSLQLIHQDIYGSYLAPTTLRERLQINGTPQGTGEPTHEISVLPNMRGILAPDLTPVSGAGWDAEIVPMLVDGDPHTIPATALAPWPASTWIGWRWQNLSHYMAATPGNTYLYKDDAHIVSGTMGSLAPNTIAQINHWETTVRGGRHHLKTVCDVPDDVDESIENNNRVVHDYVWEGTLLESDTPLTFSAPPIKNPEGYFYWSCDGFYNGGNYSDGSDGFWEVFAVMPSVDADYGIRLHSDTPTATTGFGSYEKYSNYFGYVDFVGCNNNESNLGDRVGILNEDGSTQAYTVEGEGSTFLNDAPIGAQAMAATGSVQAGEIIDVYEFQADAGQEVYFHLDVTSGDADLAVFVYEWDHDFFARSDADLTLNSGGAGESESGVFTATGADNQYYGLVICKHYRTDLDEYAYYNLYWGAPAGDLAHTARTGWDAPLVARNTGVGTIGEYPANITEGNSVADNGYINQGSENFTPGSNVAFYLDGPQAYISGDFVANVVPGGETQLSSRSLGYVKGGRHEVGAVIDVNDEIPEELPDGETNNPHYVQYCWLPYVLTDSVPVERDPAPNFRNNENPFSYSLPGYNQDGYSFNTSYWTAVGVIPHDAADQLNVGVYDYHTTTPHDGMIGNVEVSYGAPGMNTFVVMNGNTVGNGVIHDVGVRNNFTYPTVIPDNDYSVEGTDNAGDKNLNTLYGTFTISSGEILDIYDLYIPTVGDYPVELIVDSPVDLGIAIFSAGLEYGGIGDELINLNSNGAGVNEVGTLPTTETGWYGLVVYKTGTTELPLSADYRFYVGDLPDRTPRAVDDLTITPVDISGSPYRWDFQFSDVTEDINGLPLDVDYYRIWWSFDPYAEFPVGWSSWLTSVDSEFLDAGSTTANLYFLVTAVDEDGYMTVSQNGKTIKVHESEVENLEKVSPVAGESLKGK